MYAGMRMQALYRQKKQKKLPDTFEEPVGESLPDYEGSVSTTGDLFFVTLLFIRQRSQEEALTSKLNQSL